MDILNFSQHIKSLANVPANNDFFPSISPSWRFPSNKFFRTLLMFPPACGKSIKTNISEDLSHPTIENWLPIKKILQKKMSPRSPRQSKKFFKNNVSEKSPPIKKILQKKCLRKVPANQNNSTKKCVREVSANQKNSPKKMYLRSPHQSKEFFKKNVSEKSPTKIEEAVILKLFEIFSFW